MGPPSNPLTASTGSMNKTSLLVGAGALALLVAAARLIGSTSSAAAVEQVAPRAQVDAARSAPDAARIDQLEPIVDPAAVDAPRDFGCARCAETPSSDPMLADLAPVDVILLDALTGAPVPDVTLHATDLNGVTQALRADGAGRIIDDALLRAGPVSIDFTGPPHLPVRQLEEHVSPIQAEHCLAWDEPDRWHVPVPMLIPVSVAGPLDAAAVHDLFPYTIEEIEFTADNPPPGVTLGPGSSYVQFRARVASPVAEMVPVAVCGEEFRGQLSPAATHVIALRPERSGIESRSFTDPKTGIHRHLERHLYEQLPASPFRLGLWIDDGDFDVVTGALQIEGAPRLSGRPLLLDVEHVDGKSRERGRRLDELLGKGARSALPGAARRRRDQLKKAGR